MSGTARDGEGTRLAGRRVLVTGASGFIGSRLRAALVASGAEVHAVSRAPRARSRGGERWFQADLADPESARSLLAESDPDLVYHLASAVSGSRDLEAVLPTFRANLAATVSLLTAVTERGVGRVILAGSLEEPAPGEPAATPASPYAAAKAASSAYARMFHALYRTPVAVARLFMVYGPGQEDRLKLVPYVIGSLLRGQSPQLASGARPVDWVYVDDVVEGLVALALAPGVEGASVDLGSGELVSVREVAHALSELVDPSVPLGLGALPDRPMEQVRAADAAATEARIGWRAWTPLKQGLERTVEWYRANP